MQKNILLLVLIISSWVLNTSYSDASENNIGSIVGGTFDQLDRIKDQEFEGQLLKKEEDVLPREEKDKKVDNIVSSPSFKFKGIILKGNKSIPGKDLKQFWKSYIGKSIKFDDVQKIAEEVTNYYRRQGYLLSFVRVPKQVLKGGWVTLEVVEGSIGEVSVSFEKMGETIRKTLDGYIKKLKTEKPLTKDTYERFILLIKDLYKTAKVYLSRSDSGKRKAKLNIIIPKQKDLGLTALVNNYGSESIGPWMGTLALNRPSPWNSEHEIKAIYSQGTYFRELWSAGLGYEIPVNANGTRFGVDTTVVRSQPTGSISSYNVITREDNVTFNLIHPFIRSQESNLYGGIEFEVVNQYRLTRLTGDVRKERSRELSLFIISQWEDSLDGSNVIKIKGTKGLRVLNYVSQSYGSRTRSGASADALYFSGDITRFQHLYGPFVLAIKTEWQYANESLLDVDRFRSNGAPFNGAYVPTSLVGDTGIEGKLELSYINKALDHIKMLRVYAYLSEVKVWNRQPNDAEEKTSSGAGAGAGVQAYISDTSTVSLEYGYPFEKKPVDPSGKSVKPHVWFGVTMKI